MTHDSSSSQYSISQSHLISGRSKTTIRRHLAKGTLSCTVDENGRRWIAGSELARAYDLKPEDFKRLDAATNETGAGNESDRAAARQVVEGVRQQLETLTEERRREREQLQSQIDHLREALKQAQESQTAVTRLLQDQSGGGEWRAAIAELEGRIGVREQAARTEARREAIDEIKQLPWWRLLWAG